MIFHFVLMVIIMVAMVGGVNGFDLLAVGQMDYCGLSNFFQDCVSEVSKWTAISQKIFISYLKSLSPNDEIQIIWGSTCLLQ